MKNARTIQQLIAATAAVFLGFAAVAEQWSGTKQFAANADIDVAIELSGEVTVEVVSGKTVTITNSVISGEGGSLRKTGAGSLVLAGANTFDGGVTIDDGVLHVRPYKDGNGAWVVDNTSLGSGTLTMTGDGTHECRLDLWGRNVGDGNFTDVALRLANSINITGNTTATYPAFVIYYQNVVFTGKLTAANDCYFYDDYATTTEIHAGQSNRGSYVRSLTFDEVEVAGTLAQDGNCRFDFPKPVKAKKIDFTTFRPVSKFGGVGSNRNSKYFVSAVNEVGEFLLTSSVGIRDVTVDVDNAFSNTLFRMTTTSGGRIFSSNRIMSVGGFHNDVDLDPSCYKNDSTGVVRGDYNGGKAGTLKITGVPLGENEQSKHLRATREIYGLTELLLDAYPSFTQEFAVISNRSIATLTIKCGTLKVSEGASFTSPTVVSGSAEGRLEIAADAAEPAFLGCTTLNAGDGMALTAARNDFPKLTTLNVAENSKLTLSRQQPLVTTVTVNAGGELEITGADAAGALMAVTKLYVRGKLTIDPSAGEVFRSDTKLELYLYDGAELDLKGGKLKGVSKLFLNGVQQLNGEWTSAQSPVKDIIADGSSVEVVNSVSVSGTDCVWTGAGADDAMTTAANWQSVPASLTDGSAAVTISGGSGMTFANGTRLAKLVDMGSSDFTIGGTTRNDEIQIDGLVAFSNNNVTLRGNINNAYGLYQGYPNESGSYSLISANFNKYGADKSIILDNATVGKSILFRGSYNKYTLKTTAGSTNEISGYVRIEGNPHYWQIAEDSELVFSGGVTDTLCVWHHGSGTVRITKRPFVRTNYTVTGWRLNAGARLAFDVTGNDIGVGGNKNYSQRKSIHMEGEGAYLATLKDHAFTNGCVTSCSPGNGNPTTVNLRWDTVATQVVDVAELPNVGEKSVFSGTEGAMIEVLQYGTNRMKAVGHVGFHMKGHGTLLIGGHNLPSLVVADKRFVAHESTGPLEVSSGILELGADCSWLNGTNFTAKGTGTLKFSAKGQVNSKFAALHFADDGKTEIPTGVTLAVGSAEVDGVEVPVGEYTKDSTGLMANRITGAGSLKVGKLGTMIMLW